jgi:hypothetical protein
MNTPNINNSDARAYVQACRPFNGAKNDYSRNGYSVSADYRGHLYVVWSYGHWPMYVCDTRTGLWFRNYEKASRTTTKQAGQCHPCTTPPPAPLPTDKLLEMIDIASSEARRAA